MKTKEKEKSKIKLVGFDPWLEPYEDHIKTRISKYKKDRKKLLSDADDFTDFANGHLYFGFHRSNKGWYYREWAPGADSLHLIGEFNNWNPSSHPLTHLGNGYWEIFLDGKKSLWHECLVKVRVTKDNVSHDKIPLYIKRVIQDPNTHSFSGQIYCPDNDYKWMTPSFKIPKKQDLLIYEAHVGMAQEKEAIGSFSEFTNIVLPKIKEKGYNAVQLMAVMQHPYYASFGYHVSNFFAVSSWFGTPDELKILIDTAHSMDIAVFMDIVHSHVVKNTDDGINEFDGTSYQFFHEGARGNHPAWDSKLFDYSKPEVIHFLLSNIKYWMDEYHFDGFRFDAVSNLIYYEGNKNLGENIGAMEWMKRLNGHMSGYHPTVMMIAEDSTDYPGVTKPVGEHGLGFDYKWDLGWMNDTLKYFQEDPVYRQYDSHFITFSMAYFYSERFLLEFSHDEVVHGKATIINKMWGLHGDKLAQVKALYVYMMLHPGKKLNFMGNELAEYKEWDESKSLGWDILKYPDHDAFHHFTQKLNEIYLKYPALYEMDYDLKGFEWLVVDDHDQCVFAIERKDKAGNAIIAVMNFVGNTHEKYKVPVNIEGSYKEILNTDQAVYSGKNIINPRAIRSKKTKPNEKTKLLNKDHYIEVKLAPFSACIFEVKPKKGTTKKTPKKTKRVIKKTK